MINISQPEVHPKFPILHGYVAKAKTEPELQKCWIQTLRSKNFGLVVRATDRPSPCQYVETPALQIRDPRRELKPEQGAEGEDMVGIAAAIGVVAAGRDLTLVVEQPIEHMRGFAGGHRDHRGVERRVSVGEVRVDRFRGLLGVESGKLTEFKHLKYRAIDPAVLEVNGLGEFGCKVEPVYKGRKVIALRLSGWVKNLDEKKATLKELRVSRVGRKARLRGTVETIAPGPERVPPKPVELPAPGWSGLKEDQVKALRAAFPGTDIQEMEKQFVAWNAEKGVTPENYTGALYGFIKKKLTREG